jgi:hypothetical protein
MILTMSLICDGDLEMLLDVIFHFRNEGEDAERGGS